MSFANETWFDDPKSILRAQGELSKENRRTFGEVKLPSGAAWCPLYNGGVLSPQRKTIAINTTLVRFGNHSADPGSALGGWWLFRRQYTRIARLAKQYGASVPWMVRELCCILPEWGDMTMQIECRVTRPLLAWQGKGAEVYARGEVAYDARMADEEGVLQLFIPGMHDAAFFASVTEEVSRTFIPHEASMMPYVPKNLPA